MGRGFYKQYCPTFFEDMEFDENNTPNLFGKVILRAKDARGEDVRRGGTHVLNVFMTDLETYHVAFYMPFYTGRYYKYKHTETVKLFKDASNLILPTGYINLKATTPIEVMDKRLIKLTSMIMIHNKEAHSSVMSSFRHPNGVWNRDELLSKSGKASRGVSTSQDIHDISSDVLDDFLVRSSRLGLVQKFMLKFKLNQTQLASLLETPKINIHLWLKGTKVPSKLVILFLNVLSRGSDGREFIESRVSRMGVRGRERIMNSEFKLAVDTLALEREKDES